MSTMPHIKVPGWQRPEARPEPLRRPLLLSAAGHVCLLGFGVYAALTGDRFVLWGEAVAEGAATVRLVSSASVPLPAPTISTQNKVATDNPGLHNPEPPKPQPKASKLPEKLSAPEKAVELPGRNSKVIAKATDKEEPKPATKTPPRQQQPREQARLRKPPEAQLGNEIPYGQGGPVQGPYGTFQADGGTGGFEFQGGSGDFATRYSWYVTAIRNRVSGNWLRSTVDPGVRVAPRVYVTFQILRDGQIANAQLTASSGVASLDRSALRAVYDSNPMPPLPGDYPGTSVVVEFWFDLQR
jgi:TonB family protein